MGLILPHIKQKIKQSLALTKRVVLRATNYHLLPVSLLTIHVLI